MRTYIKSSEFQSRSELLIIENCLPLTDEVTVDLVLKCLQHLHLLVVNLENSKKFLKRELQLALSADESNVPPVSLPAAPTTNSNPQNDRIGSETQDLILMALSLGDGPIETEILSQRAVKPQTTNQPA